MTYYIEPSVIYWMHVFHVLNITTCVAAVFMGLGFAIMVAIYLVMTAESYYDESEIKVCVKGCKICGVIFVISLLTTIFVPDKQTCMEMLIAKTITVENVNGTIEQAKEIIDYIVDKVEESK